MQDWQLEAINKGDALDIRDTTKLKEVITKRLEFLLPTWGEEQVDLWINEWVNAWKDYEIMFYGDLDMSLAKWMPVIMINTYRKILEDFRAELKKVDELPPTTGKEKKKVNTS